MYKLVLILILCSFSGILSETNAQTYFYKRTKIIKNGNAKTANDDAHYITFNRGVCCYDSDAKGCGVSGRSLKYIKTQKGIECYFGDCVLGNSVHCYVESDKSRINIKVDDNETHVYVKTTASTTAKRRTLSKNNNSGGGVIINPTPGANTQVAPASKSQKRICPSCNGEGKGPDQITWGTNYVTTTVYCPICNRSGDPHSHRRPMCRTCYGRGTIE